MCKDNVSIFRERWGREGGREERSLGALQDTGFSHILLGQMSESKGVGGYGVSGLDWHILV